MVSLETGKDLVHFHFLKSDFRILKRKNELIGRIEASVYIDGGVSPIFFSLWSYVAVNGLNVVYI